MNVRLLAMVDSINAPADALRDQAKRHEEAAKRTDDPLTEEREKARAKEDEKKATEIENDIA